MGIKSTLAGAAIGVGVVVTAVPLAGFTTAGVAAGSIAAAVQSTIGCVSAGSTFAALQSAGVLGLAGTTKLAAAGVGGAVGYVVKRIW